MTYRVTRDNDAIEIQSKNLCDALDAAAMHFGWIDFDGVCADVLANGEWIPASEVL